MTTTQYKGILSYVNEEGNIVEMYPEIKTDDTLSTSGKAADAKAVGDKISAIENVIDNEVADLETKINSFDETKSELVDSALGTALSMSTDDSWDDITSALGEVTNKGAYTSSISTSGGSVTIPKGYHNGSGKVTGPTLANLIGTNVTLASSSKLLSGYTAYGKNGVKYTGTASSYSDGYDAGYDAGYNSSNNTSIGSLSSGRKTSTSLYLSSRPKIFFFYSENDNYGVFGFYIRINSISFSYVYSYSYTSNGSYQYDDATFTISSGGSVDISGASYASKAGGFGKYYYIY